MAARYGPGYNQLNPFSNQQQPQYARQYPDSDADSYTSRNASSVPLATAGYYDGTYTPQCEHLSVFPSIGCVRRRPAPSVEPSTSLDGGYECLIMAQRCGLCVGGI